MFEESFTVCSCCGAKYQRERLVGVVLSKVTRLKKGGGLPSSLLKEKRPVSIDIVEFGEKVWIKEHVGRFCSFSKVSSREEGKEVK